MKINPIKKSLSLALAVLLAVGAVPATASAVAGLQEGTPVFTKNSTGVSFAGREWYVIGDGISGVSPLAGHLTLLAKTSFGDSEFRRYTGGGYEGSYTYPSDYNDSTLMHYLAAAANALPASEAALITARDLEPPVSAQKLWPLSMSEYQGMGTIINDPFINTNGYGNYFRLRTPYNIYEMCVGVRGGGTYVHRHVDDPTVSVRPALHLNLASVLFTSGASAKSSAAVGGGLIGTSAPSGTLKFTMEDSAQTLKVLATTAQSTQSGTTLSFGYTDAATGTNQYVSCVLADNSGAVKYYGKLADSSSAASGALSVPLSGVVDGTYTLKIFSEQANGDLYTDFAGTPIEMGLSVSSGTGTVSSFGGIALPSDDAGLVGVAGQSISAAGSGTLSAPKTAGITVANSVSAIAEADITAATGASVKLYADSAFATEESVNLNEGGGNHLYIKVTAQDGTILYYDVTVTRDADPDIPTVAAAQAKANNAHYNNMTQAAASSETVIVNALKATAAAAVDDNTVTVTIHRAGLGYQLPIAGDADNVNGVNGRYCFKVTVTKGAQSQDTGLKYIDITATLFTGLSSADAVAAAKAAIVDGAIHVPFGADQADKTAAVQSYVNSLLTGDAAGVTATVTYSSANQYNVALSKGSASGSKSIAIAVNEAPDPDIATVHSAFNAVNSAPFDDINQDASMNEAIVSNLIKDISIARINNPAVNVTITPVSTGYVTPVAGNAGNPSGTNGSYTFAVTVSKGVQSQTTAQKAITILATPFSPNVSVAGISLNAGSLSLYSNTAPNTASLIATVSPGNAANKAVAWASGNLAVATVDASGKVTAVGNGTAVITATTADGGYTAACTVTVTTYTSGDSGDGGGSGNPAITTIPGMTPGQPMTAVVSITAAPGANGTACAVIGDQRITDAIAQAQADARAQSSFASGIAIALNVAMPQGAASLTVTLSQSALQSLVSAGVSRLTINGAPVSLSLDLNALKEAQRQSEGDISISFTPIIKLSKTAKALLGNRPAYTVAISYVRHGKTRAITNLKKGTATLSIPYAPGADEAAENIFGASVDSRGRASRIKGSKYDPVSGRLILSARKLSSGYGVEHRAP